MEVGDGSAKLNPLPSMKKTLLTLCSLALLGSLARAEEFDLKASIERGKGVYMQTIACHLADGSRSPRRPSLRSPGAIPAAKPP